MSKFRKSILALIAEKPHIRTVEIAEEVGCDIDHVDYAIAHEVKCGFVVAKQFVAPNGKPQNSYRMCTAKREVA